MGKSKARILRKGINNQIPTMSRAEAINEAASALNNNDITQAKYLISFFGLGADEVLEAGACYEAVVAIKNIF